MEEHATSIFTEGLRGHRGRAERLKSEILKVSEEEPEGNRGEGITGKKKHKNRYYTCTILCRRYFALKILQLTTDFLYYVLYLAIPQVKSSADVIVDVVLINSTNVDRITVVYSGT